MSPKRAFSSVIPLIAVLVKAEGAPFRRKHAVTAQARTCSSLSHSRPWGNGGSRPGYSWCSWAGWSRVSRGICMRETDFLRQRLSIAIQRGNALAIWGSLGLHKDCEERDGWTECPFWRHPFCCFYILIDSLIVYLICAAFLWICITCIVYFYCMIDFGLSDIVELGFYIVTVILCFYVWQ